MGIEDVELNSFSAITAITRNALGVRGIDAISRTTSSGTSVAYPLYDAHSNNVGLLSKSGSSWSLGDERTYDAWGQVRSGASTGDQKGRYCANLGHKQDDESGLVYMRARYYEPASGRFVSQDSSRQGINWFSYCKNDGVNFVDETGNNWRQAVTAMLTCLGFTALLVAWAIAAMPDPTKIKKVAIIAAIEVAVVCAALAFDCADAGQAFGMGFINDIAGAATTFLNIIATIAEAMNWGCKAGLATIAVMSSVAHSVVLLGLIARMLRDESNFDDPISFS